jgi:hypothetical protein
MSLSCFELLLLVTSFLTVVSPLRSKRDFSSWSLGMGQHLSLFRRPPYISLLHSRLQVSLLQDISIRHLAIPSHHICHLLMQWWARFRNPYSKMIRNRVPCTNNTTVNFDLRARLSSRSNLANYLRPSSRFLGRLISLLCLGHLL